MQNALQKERLSDTPPGCPEWITPELIAETVEVWQPYYAEELTTADAIGILRQVGLLFDTLSA